MFEPETLVRLVVGTFLVANIGIFFLAPESRASRPPLRVAWATASVFADDIARRGPRADDVVTPRRRGIAPATDHTEAHPTLAEPHRLPSSPSLSRA